MTSGGAAASVRCPDCGKALGPLVGVPACTGCARALAPVEGVWDLLPRALGTVQANEDRVHLEAGEPTWRRLVFHKQYWLERCEGLWLPSVVDGRTRSFLELGGGLCYASALAKQRAPQAFVVASDVSPRYLRRHAVAVGGMLQAPADVYAAVDAEALPFEDDQFDAVYSQVVLYRLPDPARALREIRRVLAPGGRYLGIERASPWARPFLAREAREMGARSARRGLAERPLRWRDWRAVLRAAGADPAALAPVAGRRLRAPALRRLLNATRAIHVTIRLTK
jgi:SAM-dependent methyltransferase